jgi:hypothetical protein
MGEDQAGQERLLKQLIGTFRCHVCRHAFENDHVRVAARQEQLWIVSVRCRRCRNQQVFWVALKDQPVPQDDSPDLSSTEEERFAAMSPVASDDVLDVHEFLSEFNGDFKGLFAGKPS